MKPTLYLPVFFACCTALAQAPALPDEEDVPEVEEEWDFTTGRGLDAASRERLDMLVPEGRAHEGLRYPIYGAAQDGKAPPLESQFESKKLTRLDATHLEFHDAIVSFFGDSRYPDIATRMVTLVDAIYDFQHDILFSSSPVQILERGMIVRGGSVLHDRVSGITVFSGGLELYFNEPDAP